MFLGPCNNAGFTNGCCNSGNVPCFLESEQCSCDHGCYSEGNCCRDIQEIGCLRMSENYFCVYSLIFKILLCI